VSAEILALGASHKTASIELREKLALPAGRASRVLAELTGHEAVQEAAALSTCNRTEIYLVTTDPGEAEVAVLGILSRQAGLRPSELLERVYSFHADQAVEHLFSVTSGLDSMIVGESEIQGQVKRAYELALVEGVTGPISNRLFRDALATGKRVRSETGIARSSVSVATVAVQLAADFLGGLDGKHALVIGAGENAELTVRTLHERGVDALFVANRRYERARELAQRYDGRAVTFETLPKELERADIVVSSTGAPHQIVGREELEHVATLRMDRPLVLIDLAVPRDIDPDVRACPEVALYDMDDLQRAVAENMSGREAEVEAARALVREEVARFEEWQDSLDVVPTISALRQRGEEVVEHVLRENEARWESLSEADRERVEVLARAVVSRLLHEPTLRLKGSAGEESSYRHVHALRELFGLDAALAPHEEPAKVTRLDVRRRAPRR
jgi:glutamyl-tRNA reductase